jgi:hypothetical protein
MALRAMNSVPARGGVAGAVEAAEEVAGEAGAGEAGAGEAEVRMGAFLVALFRRPGEAGRGRADSSRRTARRQMIIIARRTVIQRDRS